MPAESRYSIEDQFRARDRHREPADMMPIDEAVEVLCNVTRTPAGGVIWSRRELAERAILAELDAARARLAEQATEIDNLTARLRDRDAAYEQLQATADEALGRVAALEAENERLRAAAFTELVRLGQEIDPDN